MCLFLSEASIWRATLNPYVEKNVQVLIFVRSIIVWTAQVSLASSFEKIAR